jgi:hypothetical protein
MNDAVNKILGPELHGKVPPGFDGLDETALRHLAAAVRGAGQAQKADLAQALEAALGHVPALLRGAVRKILLPGGGA